MFLINHSNVCVHVALIFYPFVVDESNKDRLMTFHTKNDFLLWLFDLDKTHCSNPHCNERASYTHIDSSVNIFKVILFNY